MKNKTQQNKNFKYNKQIKKRIGAISLKRSKNGLDTFIPASSYRKHIYTRKHNKTLDEQICQDLIKKEQIRYAINSTYYPHYLNIQRRLDRNYRKYKKTGNDKYKAKIIYYKQLVKKQNKYLDSLNKTSKKNEEKTLKPNFNLIN